MMYTVNRLDMKNVTMELWNSGKFNCVESLKVSFVNPPTQQQSSDIGTEYCIEVVISSAAFRERGKYLSYEIFFRDQVPQ